jgi:hypothetical protein
MKKTLLTLTFFSALICLLLVGRTGFVKAWWVGGHQLCTRAAASKIPADMPEFFRHASPELAEMAAEPDNWKHPTAPHLKSSEGPEHYIDLEYLEGAPLPAQRYDLMKLYATKNVDFVKGGFLPYALIEGYERLMLAFRECRNHPESAAAKNRAIMYAGWLAHYAQDAAMPLHTTIFYDGLKTPDGTLVQKGIHARIDAYPEKHGLTVEELNANLAAENVGNVWALILKNIEASHGFKEKCYEIDALDGFDKAPEKGRALMLERSRAATKLTLDLWYSAWINSDPEKATIKPEK